ncbi:MAG: hypothetical protein AAGF14_03150 [Pseudomonadota bacterium]
MAQFYVSHAFEDRGSANTLISWLGTHAFSPGVSTFVTTPRFDDNQNHPKQAVEAIQQSDAVVMLCSKAWAECKQCYAEYVAAQAAGKFLVAVTLKKSGQKFALEPEIPHFTIDKVGDDLSDLVSVLSAFERADPYGFEWTTGERPFPGVRAFRPGEAGVYFGRERDTQNVVARISAMLLGEANDLTLLVGPTGSGVSSLLMAGVLPALARVSDDNYILPLMRPRLRPLDALAVSIAAAMGAPENWRRWSDRMTRAITNDLASFVERCVAELREHVGNPQARLILPVDQLEELFQVSDPLQARAFEAFIAVVSASNLGIHVIATLGSEHVNTFKNARLGVCNWKPISIEPIPLERYGELIRGPAQRAGIVVEDDLVNRIAADVADIEQDRLSRLAYLLRLFWRLEAPFGRFSIDLYERLSEGDVEMPALAASIAIGAELAVEDANMDFESRKAVGSTLVNLAVRWDVNSRPIRMPFALEDVPREKIELLDRLEDAGLIEKAEVGDQHLGEIASLALFRCWPRLERLLRAQSEGPDIVVSHCREVSCVVLGPEEAPANKKRVWWKTGAFVGESMTAAVFALVIAMALGPLQERLSTDEHAPQIVANLASPIEYFKPLSRNSRGDELQQATVSPTKESAVRQRAPDKQGRQPAAKTPAITPMLQPAILPPDLLLEVIRLETGKAARIEPVIQPVVQPAILPPDLLAEIIRLKPPEASRAVAADNPADGVVARNTTVELPSLLEIMRTKPTSENDATHMLLALEALLHPNASLLTGQQRSALRRQIRQGLERHFDPRTFRIHDGRLFSATFSPSGKHIASASKDGIARLWDAGSGAEVKAFKTHEGAIYGVAYSPDGSKLITTSHDRTARIWNIATGERSTVLQGHEGAVYRAAFDVSGSRVVTASADGSAIIWDSGSGKKLKALKGHGGPVWSAEFSRGGGEVLTTSKDNTARVWRADTGEQVLALKGHKADVVTGGFSPDGKTIATGSRDGSVLIWEASTGRRVANLLGHSGPVFSAQFSDDGMFLVTASFDGTARIWELATGEMSAEFRAKQGEMRHAELAPDGQSLRTVTDDGTVTIWPVALTPSRVLQNVLRATKGCLSTTKRRAINLSGDMPWWCRLSSAELNYDMAQTKR